MKIKIEKVDKAYYADCLDCTGTPPIGWGKTKEEALAALIYVMMFDSTGGPNPSNWMHFIRKDEPIVINGKTWKNPLTTQR